MNILKNRVIRLSSYKYLAPKNRPNIFCDYMKERGWTLLSETKSKTVFVKNGEKKSYTLEIKPLYSVWVSKSVIYRGIRF